METIFMNTENSKTNEPHRFKLDLTDELNLKNPNKNMALANLSIYYTWKNIKSEYKNKFKISAPTWNDTSDLPDGSYSISDIQNYFEFIIKKHETLTENPPIQIYPNKFKNRIVFKIKTGYKLELLTPEIIKLLGLTKKDVDLFSFVPNKQFGQLINISPHSLTMMNTGNTEFSFVEVWFTDQISKALEIEDNVNLTLIIG